MTDKLNRRDFAKVTGAAAAVAATGLSIPATQAKEKKTVSNSDELVPGMREQGKGIKCYVEKRGWTCIEVPYETCYTTFGSGIHCSTASIWREA